MGSDFTFAESLLNRLKGKVVEVYSGDTATTRLYSDVNVSLKDVIRGELQDAEGEWLIIKVNTVNGSNLVYVNTWNIHSVVEPKNGVSMVDVYTMEHEKVRK